MYKLVAKRKGYYDAITFFASTQEKVTSLLFDLLNYSTDEIEVKVSIVKDEEAVGNSEDLEAAAGLDD